MLIFVILLAVFTVNCFSALFCPDLNTTIANGKVECDRHFKRGSICRYSCHWGFELDPLGHEGKFCLKNGTWVGKNPPKCVCMMFHFVFKIILQCGLSVMLRLIDFVNKLIKYGNIFISYCYYSLNLTGIFSLVN